MPTCCLGRARKRALSGSKVVFLLTIQDTRIELLCMALQSVKALAGACTDGQAGKAESWWHQVGMFFRCDWHMQKTHPRAMAHLSTWYEATGKAHGKGLEYELVAAQVMEEEAYLPGCVSPVLGKVHAGAEGAGRTMSCAGSSALLVVLELAQRCRARERRRL